MKSFILHVGLFFLLLIVSCSTDKENINTILEEIESIEKTKPSRSLTSKELEFLDEYEYITFNVAPDSYGADVNEKWDTDIKLFITGSFYGNYIGQVEQTLDQFNELLGDATNMNLVDSEEASNIHLIYGDKEDIREVWPDMYDAIGDVNYTGYALYNSNAQFQITKGRIWVKNGSIPLFAHELGHTIGLGHASESFCSGVRENNESFMCSFLRDDLSVFDKAIIKTLYSPDVEVGLTFAQLKPIIEELLLTDDITVE